MSAEGQPADASEAPSGGRIPEGLDIGFWFPRPDRGARLAAELRMRGHRVTIYHSLPIPGDQSGVRKVPYGLIGGLRALRKLPHEVLYTSRSFTPVVQLLLNRWLGGPPYVFTINGALWTYYGERRSLLGVSRAWTPVYSRLLRLAVGGASTVVCNSRFLADGLRARFPRYAARVTTVYNGIDFEAVEAGRERPEQWPKDGPRVLSAVTVNFERKAEGLSLLLAAFGRILSRHPSASYLIAAKSSAAARTDAARQHLATLAYADKVRIEVNREDVPDLLASADLFLYATPSDSSDSLPRALLEAQAAGVPTVTTATVGCAEAVLEDETGKTVPYDAGALGDAALELLADQTKASALAARGKVSVRERFRWESMAESYEGLFRQAVRSR